MQFDYDKETDSLYITLVPGGSVDSEEITNDVIVDYDAQGRVVGLDIQHASTQMDLAGIQVRGFLPKFDIQTTS